VWAIYFDTVLLATLDERRHSLGCYSDVN